MSLTYAIPDLHGRVDLFDQALARILLHSGGKTSLVVMLGDYIDRGPSSREVIERLLDWSYPTLRLIALKGNHEAMMWEACHGLCEVNWWLENGGAATLASYGRFSPDSRPASIIPPGHLRWIEQLPTVYADANRIFVHAGVDSRLPLDQQSESTLLWKRYREGSSLGYGRRHVVHGHQADERAPILLKGRTNLDAMAWRTGRLVIGVFQDDRPGGAVEFLEVGPKPAGLIPNSRASQSLSDASGGS